MSTWRLLVTTFGMALVGVLLAHLGPDPGAVRAALAQPQHVADTLGPDAVVLAWAAALAWAVWAWGLAGLGLTAATAIPGLLGGVARTLLRGVLPAGARRAAALALGVGLGVGVGAPAFASPAPGEVVAAAPDWPATESRPAPDWPTGVPAAGDHVVVRGDCLWDIAAARLRADAGRPPSTPEIAAAGRAWWAANRSVIGPDPDLLLPGQVLHPPGLD